MKTLLTTALLLITSVSAFSQDTLFTRNGQMIPAKVYEITQTDIKYKRPSNPNGPLYTVSKDDIAVIEYRNGSKDVFPYEQQTSQQGQSTDNYNNGNAYAQPVNNNYYGNPNANVNVMLGMGGGWGGLLGMGGYGYGGGFGIGMGGYGYGMGMGWGGFGGGWGWGRPYYGYGYGGWGGYRGGWGGYRGGWGGGYHGGWGGGYHGGGFHGGGFHGGGHHR